MRTLILVSIISLSLFSACRSDENHDLPGSDEAVTGLVEKKAVCIWDGGAVRKIPARDGKWISSMVIGEKVTWLGETKIDSSKQDIAYHQIRLSDGTVGWASEYVIELEADPGVVIDELPIYKRPNLLTVTDEKFYTMDIVAIVHADPEWLEVIGAEKKKRGWIENRNISLNETDIAVAMLAGKALAEKDPAEKRRKLIEIIGNNAFTSSIFMPYLNDLRLELFAADSTQ